MKKMILLSLFIFSVSLGWATEISQPEALSKFNSAAEHYRHNDYSQAVTDYESIIAGNRENGHIYYNLGNSYYRQGMVGKAVLNYERALRLMPRDSDLNFNFRFVTANLPSYGNASSNLIHRLVEGHENFYSRREMILILCLLFLSFIIVNICWKIFHSIRPLLFNIQLVIAFIFMVFLVGLVVKIEAERNRAIVLEKAQARFEPKADATVHYSLVAGEKVREVRQEAGWIKVERPDGKLGWVEDKKLEAIE